MWSPHPISSFNAHPRSTRSLPNALVETLPTVIILPPNLSCRTISHVGLNLGPCISFGVCSCLETSDGLSLFISQIYGQRIRVSWLFLRTSVQNNVEVLNLRSPWQKISRPSVLRTILMHNSSHTQPANTLLQFIQYLHNYYQLWSLYLVPEVCSSGALRLFRRRGFAKSGSLWDGLQSQSILLTRLSTRKVHTLDELNLFPTLIVASKCYHLQAYLLWRKQLCKHIPACSQKLMRSNWGLCILMNIDYQVLRWKVRHKLSECANTILLKDCQKRRSNLSQLIIHSTSIIVFMQYSSNIPATTITLHNCLSWDSFKPFTT